MDTEAPSPFRPGAGTFPPLLAGREQERFDLEDGLARIRTREPGGLVVLHGPRGNGKTTLLAYLEELARREGIEVREFEPDPFTCAGPEAPWMLAGGETPPAPSGADGLGSVRALASSGPLVLLVDEAHVLPATFGTLLLHSTHGCVRSGLPLLAVFAGTPELPAKLRTMHERFWERAKNFGIGRLESDGEAREALAIPAERSGRPIDDDALEVLVRHSERYPFFVQTFGDAAWDASCDRGGDPGRITIKDAHRGVADAAKRLTRFHGQRRAELHDHLVLGVAEAISEEMVALGDNATLPWRRLAELAGAPNARGRAGDPATTQEALLNLGLIWPAGPAGWEPGIPSLCTYLVKHRGRRL